MEGCAEVVGVDNPQGGGSHHAVLFFGEIPMYVYSDMGDMTHCVCRLVQKFRKKLNK